MSGQLEQLAQWGERSGGWTGPLGAQGDLRAGRWCRFCVGVPARAGALCFALALANLSCTADPALGIVSAGDANSASDGEASLTNGSALSLFEVPGTGGHGIQHFHRVAADDLGNGVALHYAGPPHEKFSLKYFRLQLFTATGLGPFVDLERSPIYQETPRLAVNQHGVALSTTAYLDNKGQKTQLQVSRWSPKGQHICTSGGDFPYASGSIFLRGPHARLLAQAPTSPWQHLQWVDLSVGCKPVATGASFDLGFAASFSTQIWDFVVHGPQADLLLATAAVPNSKQGKRQPVELRSARFSADGSSAQLGVIAEVSVAPWSTENAIVPCAAAMPGDTWLIAVLDSSTSRMQLRRWQWPAVGDPTPLPPIDVGQVNETGVVSGGWCAADDAGHVCADAQFEYWPGNKIGGGLQNSTFVCFDLKGKQLGAVTKVKQWPTTYVSGIASAQSTWAWWVVPNGDLLAPGHLLVGKPGGGPGADVLVDLSAPVK